jgi:hypothetical protein
MCAFGRFYIYQQLTEEPTQSMNEKYIQQPTANVALPKGVVVDQKFSQLTVVSRSDNDAAGRVRLRCKCECGGAPATIWQNPTSAIRKPNGIWEDGGGVGNTTLDTVGSGLPLLRQHCDCNIISASGWNKAMPLLEADLWKLAQHASALHQREPRSVQGLWRKGHPSLRSVERQLSAICWGHGTSTGGHDS